VEDAVEVQEQRGLAGAVGADEGYGFPPMHRQADAAERRLAVGVAEAKVIHAYNLGHISPYRYHRFNTMDRTRTKPRARTNRKSRWPKPGFSRVRVCPSKPRDTMAA